MPRFDFPTARRYNTLRLLGYDYNSTWQLCAISFVTDLRRPLFADVDMAKRVLKCLVSNETLEHMRVRAFTLMRDHLHFLAGVRAPEKYLPSLIGFFKSYTTQQYWKRSREIINSRQVVLPSSCVTKVTSRESRPLIEALMDWHATLRPEVVELKNWPSKARTVSQKTFVGDGALGSRNPKRLRPTRESRLHRDESGARRLRHASAVLSLHGISLLIPKL